MSIESSLFSNISDRPLYVAAPMVRYSKLSFRKLVRKYGCDLCYSPMIISSCFNQSKLARDVEFTTDSGDRPLIMQFAANNAIDLATAAEFVYKYSDGVDLNCGCPQRWAMAERYGSHLINHPELIADMVKQTRARVGLNFNVSIKIRVHYDLRKTVDLCQKAEAAGVSFIAVHARTPSERHESVEKEIFRYVSDACSVPIVANGDVRSVSDAKLLYDQYGIKGVMSARALLQNPALYDGYNVTPVECIRDWVDISLSTGVTFAQFHHQLMFMMEKLLSRSEKRLFNRLQCVPAVLTYLQNRFDIKSDDVLIRPCKCQRFDMIYVSANVHFGIFTIILFHHVYSYHINGVWSTDDAMTVVAKFAFQRTDTVQPKETRGYVYGNVTLRNAQYPIKDGAHALLILVNFEHFHRIYAHRDLKNGDSSKFCSIALKAASEAAFDARCLPNGKQDFFRRIPCPKGDVCFEEDDPSNVVHGYQLTYQIQDKAQARFWFVLLMNCRLDTQCNWTRGWTDENGTGPLIMDYDLWLVNGDPNTKYYNPFEHQFSFDQMDTFEIFLSALVVNLILIGLQYRASNIHRSKRAKFLISILSVQCIQIALSLVHVGVFAANGRGIRVFRILGELLELMADFMLILLLICIAKGWTIKKSYVVDRNKLIVGSIAYCISTVVLYFWSNYALEDLLDVDIFQTWPGWGLLLLRILAMVWFLIELRRSVRAEYDEAKVSFLLHFGAGFLVWFIYLPVLGALSSQMSVMWRYKIFLSIAYLADFVACAILIHLFWPSSTNRSYFLHNASNLGTSDELDDYEKAIIMEDLEGISHIEDSSGPLNGQVT